MSAITARGATHDERIDRTFPAAVLYLLVFQNLFNAVSPYITLAINVAVALSLLIRHRFRHVSPEPIVIIAVYVLLAWLMLVTAYRGDAEQQVVLKYVRVTVTVSLFALIFGSCLIPSSSMVKAVNFALAFHVLLVILQIAVPEITNSTAPIFGFERETTILEEYTLRKLGASSSYDTASLLSVAAFLFFYFQLAQGKGAIYLLATAIGFVATLMSSRAGIAVSLLIVLAIGLQVLMRASRLWKFVASAGIAGFLVFAYLSIYPLLLHSLGVSELQSDEGGFFFDATDYGTTGTLEALMDDHLLPLQQPLDDLFFGYAVDPNTIGKHTDIGYVKLIYHVGIVGTAIVLFLHLYMLAATRRLTRTIVGDPDRALIGRFLFVLIAIAIAFNYKSLELHSRGIGDFIYLLFLYLASWRGSQGGHSNPSRSGAKCRA